MHSSTFDEFVRPYYLELEQLEQLASREADLGDPAASGAITEARDSAKIIDEELARVWDLRSDQEQDVRVAQGRLASILPTAALTVGQIQQNFARAGATAKGLVKKVINWFINHVVSVIQTLAGALHVDKITVEASGPAFQLKIAVELT